MSTNRSGHLWIIAVKRPTTPSRVGHACFFSSPLPAKAVKPFPSALPKTLSLTFYFGVEVQMLDSASVRTVWPAWNCGVQGRRRGQAEWGLIITEGRDWMDGEMLGELRTCAHSPPQKCHLGTLLTLSPRHLKNRQQEARLSLNPWDCVTSALCKELTCHQPPSSSFHQEARLVTRRRLETDITSFLTQLYFP